MTLTVNDVTDLYDTAGRLMYPNGKEISVAGGDAEEKAEKLNGNPGDFSADKTEARELSDREAGDLGELVAIRWLKEVAPEAFDRAPSLKRGESETADVIVNGLKIDVKARDLSRGNDKVDLLVGAGEFDRKQEDIDFYISVVVSADREEVIIQGGANPEYMRQHSFVRNLGHGPVRILEQPDLLNPNQLLDKLTAE